MALPLVLFLSVLSACAHARGGEPDASPPLADLAFDAATGRDLTHDAPDSDFEHRHFRLEVEIPDPAVARLTGRATLTLAALGRARDRVRLDARRSLTVRAVTVDGQPARFGHDGRKLTITIDPPATPGTEHAVVIDYAAENPAIEGNGLIVLAGEADRADAADPLVYSQGQSEWNSRWFPCHDFPNLRTTTEVLATVPEGFEVISNGRLVSNEPAGSGQRRWHWLQDRPHPYYLVSLVVGRFDTVDLGGPASARPGLAVSVHGPKGSADRLRKVFAETPRMVAFLEREFDEPFPWAKYAQVLVRDFRWGGMENTSATTLAAGMLGRSETDQQSLIVHELAHQWMGDLVTCRSWEHLWLNEGWASFAEALWMGERDGPAGYDAVIDGWAAELIRGGRGDDLEQPPMQSPLYREPDDTAFKPNSPYSKGGMVLHMLRLRVGDDAFWKGTRAYIDRHRFNQAETDDFRRAIEEASGQSLTRFFRQWCRWPGLPRLAVDLAWTPAADAGSSPEGAGTLSVTIEQVQSISTRRPAYELEIPIEIDSRGTTRSVTFATDQRVLTREFALPSRPGAVRVNPRWGQLAEVAIRTPLAAEPATDRRLDFEQAERERLRKLRQPLPAGQP